MEAVLDELEGAYEEEPAAEAARLQRLQRIAPGACSGSVCGICREDGAQRAPQVNEKSFFD